MRAVKLISPPTNPSILMLVHIGLGHIKPMINDVLIGLFSSGGSKVLSWQHTCLSEPPSLPEKNVSCGEIKARYILERAETQLYTFVFQQRIQIDSSVKQINKLSRNWCLASIIWLIYNWFASQWQIKHITVFQARNKKNVKGLSTKSPTGSHPP